MSLYEVTSSFYDVVTSLYEVVNHNMWWKLNWSSYKYTIKAEESLEALNFGNLGKMSLVLNSPSEEIPPSIIGHRNW